MARLTHIASVPKSPYKCSSLTKEYGNVKYYPLFNQIDNKNWYLLKIAILK